MRLKIIGVLLFILTINESLFSQGTVMPIGPQQATWSNFVRGYHFTAPTDFTICSLYIPDDASTDFQSVAVVRFTNGAPPAFAGTTNDFVQLFYEPNHVPNTPIPVNIQVNTGDIIGIYGARGGGQVNSYNGIQHNTNIDGLPVVLERSGMQASLATNPMQNIWSEVNGRIGRIEMTYNCCPSPEEPTGATASPNVVDCGDETTLEVQSANPLDFNDYNWYWYEDSCGGTPIDSGEVITLEPPAVQNVTYYVRAEGECDTSDCQSVQVQVVQSDFPNWEVNTTICENEPPVDLNNFITNSSSGTWSGTGVSGNMFDPSGGSQAVTYTVGAPPCEYDSTLTIQVEPTPQVDPISDIVVCNNDQVPTINFSSSPGGADFSWSNNNTSIGLGANGTGDINSFTGENNGNTPQTAVITVTPELNTCVGPTETFEITVNGLVDPSWDIPEPPCENGGVVNLNNLVTGSPGGDWSGTGVDNGTFDPSMGSQNVTYTVGVAPCEETLTQMIEVNPTPNANFTSDVTSGCQDLTINFINSSSSLTGYENCTWNLGDGSVINSCDDFEHTYTSAGVFGVSLTVTNEFGCTDTRTQGEYIEVSPQPEADFDFDPSNPNILDKEVRFINNTTGAVNYQWTFGDVSSSSEQSPIIEFGDEPQEIEVELVATTPLGCVDTLMRIVNIEDVLLYYIPNTFTPDTDKINPEWKPIFTSGFDPHDYNLIIFNRWGEVVFESNNAEVGWKGKYGTNMDAPEGVYTYKIEFATTMSDERKVVSGHVNLLR